MALSQALANRLWYYKPMGKIWDMNDEGKAKIKAYAQERYKNSSEVVSCANCNKQYKVAISRVALGRGKYCSRLCKGQYSRGKRVSVDTEFKKGQKPWNAGTGEFTNCIICTKKLRVQPNRKNAYCSIKCMSIASTRIYTCAFCSKEFSIKGRGGIKIPKYCSNKCQGLGSRGANHPMWNGGSSKEREIAKGRVEYKNWRTSVFTRDDFTCQLCFARGVPLEADHIKQWALYPELRYEITNGRTLCKPCHRKTPTWGRLNRGTV